MRWDKIVSLLRLFADPDVRNYSVVDRIANALSYEAVEVALYDALRIARSLIGNEPNEVKAALSRMGVQAIQDIIPGDEELGSFLAAARRDIGAAREVAIKALGSA